MYLTLFGMGGGLKSPKPSILPKITPNELTIGMKAYSGGGAKITQTPLKCPKSQQMS